MKSDTVYSSAMAARFVDETVDDDIVNMVGSFAHHINQLGWSIHVEYDISPAVDELNGLCIPVIVGLYILDRDSGYEMLTEEDPNRRIQVHNIDELQLRLTTLYHNMFDCFCNEEQREHPEMFELTFSRV